MVDRRRWRFGLGLLVMCSYATTAAAQSDEPSGKPSSGSFQPPINLVDNDVRYASGAGVAVFAGPLQVFGVVAGAGRPFGPAEPPRWGFEAQLALLRGGGDFSAVGATSMTLVTSAGSFIVKRRMMSPGEDRMLGLTLYGGPTLGFFQLGIENDFGTAYRHYLTVGASLGALVQLIPDRRVELMAFVGGRSMAMAGIPEQGDPDAQPAGAFLATPEFGGNITVHLPHDLDVNLGSMLNFMKGEDDGKQSAKVFYLGLTWRSDAGFAPIVEGPTS